MRTDTYNYLISEVENCNKIWEEHNHNIDNSLEHFHICDFQLLAMIQRYKKSYRKFIKESEKMCEEYLTSIGHKRDKYMECCDYCPHMRYLTLTEDNYFVNIATLGLDRCLFEEEKKKNEETFSN